MNRENETSVRWIAPKTMTQSDFQLPVAFPIGFINDISLADSITSTLNAVARWLPDIIEADRASIALAKNEQQLQLFAIQGNLAIPLGKILPVRGTFIGEVYRSRTTKIAHHLESFQELDCQMLHKAGISSCLDAPLLCGDKCYGTLNIGHKQPNFFSERDALILQCLARWVATHIRVHKQLENISKMAKIDPLTGIYNRRAFIEFAEDQFKTWREKKKSFITAILDIDHFKKINDQLGHAGGDKALITFTQQLKVLVRKQDCLARFGGEEFVVLLQNIEQKQAIDWAKRLLKTIQELQIEFEQKTIQFTVSIGLTSPHPSDKNIEMVLNRADNALYHSKKTGRNRVSIA